MERTEGVSPRTSIARPAGESRLTGACIFASTILCRPLVLSPEKSFLSPSILRFGLRGVEEEVVSGAEDGLRCGKNLCNTQTLVGCDICPVDPEFD